MGTRRARRYLATRCRCRAIDGRSSAQSHLSAKSVSRVAPHLPFIHFFSLDYRAFSFARARASRNMGHKNVDPSHPSASDGTGSVCHLRARGLPWQERHEPELARPHVRASTSFAKSSPGAHLPCSSTFAACVRPVPSLVHSAPLSIFVPPMHTTTAHWPGDPASGLRCDSLSRCRSGYVR